MIDDRTEQLVNRKLDGELTEAESLELDKRLIRSPEARTLLEEYQRIDSLGAEAMGQALADPQYSLNSPKPWLKATFAPTHRWGRYFRMVTAVAAIIVMAVVIKPFIPNQQITEPMADPTVLKQDPPVVMPDQSAMAADSTRMEKLRPIEVIHGPRQQRERILRDVFGVYDPQTDSVYFLEADQMQKTAVPVSAEY